MINIQIQERVSNFLHAALAIPFGLVVPLGLVVRIVLALTS